MARKVIYKYLMLLLMMVVVMTTIIMGISIIKAWVIDNEQQVEKKSN